MPNIGIVVADRARARFLTLQPPDELAPERSSELVEHMDLVNPEGALAERELFSDRPSRSHGSPEGCSHGSDDHREGSRLEDTRRFVRRVLEEMRRFASDHAVQRWVLVAEPRLLGVARGELERGPIEAASVLELPEDLSRRTPADIHEILAHRGLLPAAVPPRAGVYRPRGQAPATS